MAGRNGYGAKPLCARLIAINGCEGFQESVSHMVFGGNALRGAVLEQVLPTRDVGDRCPLQTVFCVLRFFGVLMFFFL